MQHFFFLNSTYIYITTQCIIFSNSSQRRDSPCSTSRTSRYHRRRNRASAPPCRLPACFPSTSLLFVEARKSQVQLSLAMQRQPDPFWPPRRLLRLPLASSPRSEHDSILLHWWVLPELKPTHPIYLSLTSL